MSNTFRNWETISGSERNYESYAKEKTYHLILFCFMLFASPLRRRYFRQNITRFCHSRIIPSDKEREKGEGICEIGKKVIKRMSAGRRGAGGERDRSDRVAYSVVAGSRKEQQIQWLYRPSSV